MRRDGLALRALLSVVALLVPPAALAPMPVGRRVQLAVGALWIVAIVCFFYVMVVIGLAGHLLAGALALHRLWFARGSGPQTRTTTTTS